MVSDPMHHGISGFVGSLTESEKSPDEPTDQSPDDDDDDYNSKSASINCTDVAFSNFVNCDLAILPLTREVRQCFSHTGRELVLDSWLTLRRQFISCRYHVTLLFCLKSLILWVFL